jgi:hypothetical protein
MLMHKTITLFKNKFSVHQHINICLLSLTSHFLNLLYYLMGYTVAPRLRHCTTNRKVAGSIPDDFIGIFH